MARRNSYHSLKLLCRRILWSSVLFCVPLLAVENIQATKRVAADSQVEFDVFLPLTHKAALESLLEAQQTVGSPQYHQWLTPQQFREQFGPNAAKVARVSDNLKRLGFTITQVHGHGLRVQGPASATESVFSTQLMNGFDKRGRATVIRQTALSMPSMLQAEGAQVFAFSPRVHLRPNARISGQVDIRPENRQSPTGVYWFTDLKQAYEFPAYSVTSGKGVNIGIVMSSDYSESDMTTYFGHEGLTPPTIIRRPVLGGAPFSPDNGASFEVSLDIQQAGGMAPDANITLYNIPDLSDPAVLAGYLAIVEDNQVDIVSSSFSGPEAFYLPELNNGEDFSGILRVYEELFQQGNAQGITFVAASGDNGGLGAPPLVYLTTPPTDPPSITGYWLPGAEWPGVDPHVTGVGGTNLVTTYTKGSLTSNYVQENADGDPELPYDPFGVGNLIAGGYWGSGGGTSQVFAKPSFQMLVNTGSPKFRTVPDVSLHMGGCPRGLAVPPCGPDRSADVLVVAGKGYGAIGTSASAPDFAGLLALRESYQGTGRIGNANPLIYRLAAEQYQGTAQYPAYHTAIPGFNGYDQTRRRYDKVIGVGTAIGKNFVGAGDKPAAGDPLTPSNP